MLKFSAFDLQHYVVDKCIYKERQLMLHGMQFDLSSLTEDKINRYIANLQLTVKATSNYIVSAAKFVRPSFVTCIQPLISLEIASQYFKYTIIQAAKMHPDMVVRNASAQVIQSMRKSYDQLLHSHDLSKVLYYYLLVSFTEEKDGLTLEQQVFVKKLHLAYKLEGVGLIAADKRQTVALFYDGDDDLANSLPKLTLRRQRAVFNPVPF